jgi:outer membrane receptor for ferrienterochelin and colicins
MAGPKRLTALMLVAGLGGAAATAQTLDYGSFERMFGEPVTMSATGKPERISDTPVMMDVITADDIRRSGARDIPTLLKRMPGVDTYNGSPGTEEVSMGGYIQVLGARIMVLLNGRQIYLGSFGATFWSSLPVEMDEIRQIEVIRGPQSALYGFNAVDGVINIITFDPAVDDLNVARVRVGNDARRDGSVSLTQPIADGVGMRVTVAGDHAHDEGGSDTPLSTFQPVNPDRKMLSVDLSARLQNGDRVSFEAAHSDISQRSVPAGTAQYFDLRLKTDSVKADYTAELAVGRVGATASLTLSDAPEASNGAVGMFRLHDHNAAVQLYDLFKVTPADSVRIGFDAHDENMNIVNFSSGTISGRLLAGSVMWEHQFMPGLTLVDAVRYDDLHLGRKGANLPGDIYTDEQFNQRSIQGISVNSSLLYKPTADDTLRASFSRGLSLPSLLNYGQLAVFTPSYGGNYYYGNPFLDPSAVYEERVGWDRQVSGIEALLRLSLYHEDTMKTINDVTLNYPTPPPPLCNPANPVNFLSLSSCLAQGYVEGSGVVVNGVQLQLDHKSQSGLAWGANYSFERLHSHSIEGPSTDLKLQNSLPVHKVNASIGYGGEEWAADLRIFYASSIRGGTFVLDPYPDPVFKTVKNYITLAPHLAWSPLEHLTVELVADNLWTYRDSLAQRTPVTYYLSLVARY